MGEEYVQVEREGEEGRETGRGEGDRERGRKVCCDLVGLRYTYSTVQYNAVPLLYHVVSFHISSDCLTDI